MDTNKKLKNVLIISVICLAVSTFLFSTSPFIFDIKVNNIKTTISNITKISSYNWNEMIRAREEFLLGTQKSSENHIFILLNANKELVDRNVESIKFHLVSSVKILTTIVKGDALTKEEFYSFHKISIQDLILLYRKNFDKAVIKYNNLNKSTENLELKILKIERLKNTVLIFAILVQLIGLFLGIYISIKTELKNN